MIPKSAFVSFSTALSEHQTNNSNTGQSFEKRVTKTLETIPCFSEVIHGKGIKISRDSKPDESIRADIRAKFKSKSLENIEIVFDCTNSMRNDRIRAKKFDGLVLNSWKQKLYLHIIVFPNQDTFKSKYKNYEDEIYYCEREVVLQANNIGICGYSIALMEGDLEDFCINLNKKITKSKPTNIDKLLKISREVILDCMPEYRETNFQKKYPKYKRP